MKILIISGFLGAGKTRFITSMAKATKREFVIVENEFAEANVDRRVLNQEARSAASEMEIWELTEGCICCSLNLDFAHSVLTIANTLDPDILIVEPSGVAHLSAILTQLARITYEKIELLAPITVVDAGNFEVQRRDYRNYFEDQVGSAGTIVLSKSEGLGEADFGEIQAQLGLAEDVRFPRQHYSQWSEEAWFDLLRYRFDPSTDEVGRRFERLEDQRRADEDLSSATYDAVQMESVDALYAVCEDLVEGAYGDVIRFKGFVALPTEWVHVEGVNGRFELVGGVEPDEDQPTLVVIGKDLKRLQLRRRLQGSFVREA